MTCKYCGCNIVGGNDAHRECLNAEIDRLRAEAAARDAEWAAKVRWVIRRVIKGGTDGIGYYMAGAFCDDVTSGFYYETEVEAVANVKILMKSDFLHGRRGTDYDVLGIIERSGDKYLSEQLRHPGKEQVP